VSCALRRGIGACYGAPGLGKTLSARTYEGKTKKEITRCLKRAVVREIYTALRADLAPKDTNPDGTEDQQTAA
jgi:DNA transposition AAA+ family ATPase